MLLVFRRFMVIDIVCKQYKLDYLNEIVTNDIISETIYDIILKFLLLIYGSV